MYMYVHAVGLWRDGELLEVSIELFISILQVKVMDHTKLARDGRHLVCVCVGGGGVHEGCCNSL